MKHVQKKEGKQQICINDLKVKVQVSTHDYLFLFRDSKQNISDIVFDVDIDIFGKIERKREILKKEKLQLLNDMESTRLAGEKMVDLLREHGTETEVEKLLTHISQVEMMTHLLVLLTIRLARVEKKSKTIMNNENVCYKINQIPLNCIIFKDVVPKIKAY